MILLSISVSKRFVQLYCFVEGFTEINSIRHKFIFSFYLHLSFRIANIEYGLEICQVKGGYTTDNLVVTFK